MADPFDRRTRPGTNRRALADRLRPKTSTSCRTGASSRRERDADAAEPQARLDDPLGTAGMRQDDDSPAACPTHLAFEQISAIFSGVADLKKMFEDGAAAPPERARHPAVRRRNPPVHRDQHNRFLPVMEDGTIMLVGATTKTRPSSSTALLSRARVLVLHTLDDDASKNYSPVPRKPKARHCRSTRRRGTVLLAWPMVTAARR